MRLQGKGEGDWPLGKEKRKEKGLEGWRGGKGKENSPLKSSGGADAPGRDLNQRCLASLAFWLAALFYSEPIWLRIRYAKEASKGD